MDNSIFKYFFHLAVRRKVKSEKVETEKTKGEWTKEIDGGSAGSHF